MWRVALLVVAALGLAAGATGPRPAPQLVVRVPQSTCLVARFSAPFAREDLVRRLERMGFDVCASPREGLAVALVGSDPVNDTGDGLCCVESTEAHREAVENGATILRLADLSSLFGGPLAVLAAGARCGQS